MKRIVFYRNLLWLIVVMAMTACKGGNTPDQPKDGEARYSILAAA